MEKIMSEKEKRDVKRLQNEERRILKEIEDSFCSVGYDVLDIAVQHVKQKMMKQA